MEAAFGVGGQEDGGQGIPAIVRPDASTGFSIAALGLAALSEIIGRLQFYDLPLGLSPRR